MSSSPWALAPLRDRAVEPVLAEPVEDTGALARLEPEWARLWVRAGAGAFQSPAWLLPWWRQVGRGRLRSVAFRAAGDGRLVGLVAMFVHVRDDGRRQLMPVGVATTDRLDVLVEPAWRTRVLAALVGQLLQLEGEWDVLEAPQLPEGAAWLDARWPRSWRVEVSPADPNPVLALPPAWPDHWARRLAQTRRRAAREGALECEQADAASLPGLLDDLVRLHGERWALRGEAGVLHDAAVLAWHREAAPLLLRAGLLRLLGLRIAGQRVAVLHGLLDPPAARPRRWSYYLGGFDPAAAALSPGTLLVAAAIERAQAEGADLFDFLRGGEAYKARWGAVAEPMHVLRVRPLRQAPARRTGP